MASPKGAFSATPNATAQPVASGCSSGYRAKFALCYLALQQRIGLTQVASAFRGQGAHELLQVLAAQEAPSPMIMGGRSQTLVAQIAPDATLRAPSNRGDDMKKIAVLIAVLCVSCGALAHSGGTDKNGCHRDHKTGGSHCH
jgi:hypothetical protein